MNDAPERPRILYIDDDPVLARLIQKALARAGMEVIHAPDADEANRLLAAEPFHAVVLDHYLPSGTGLEILGRMRAGGSRVPAIYVTGSSEATIAVAALKAGADDYVIKSATDEFLPLLQRSIRQAIAKVELEQAKARADAETRAARARAEMLLSEVHHRVANSLAMVQSLLRLQAQASGSDEVKTALAEAQGRIGAVAAVHRSLYLGNEGRQVELGTYLRTMLDDFTATLPPGVQLDVSTETVHVGADRAVCLGVVVSELVTNAAKYAWPSGNGGQLSVRLAVSEPGRGRLEVCDDGIGSSPLTESRGTGLGRRLMRAMVDQLGGTVEQPATAAGTCVVIDFEAESETAD
ncbi:response regulator [Cereibacter azotoformans]|uniref:histidine kinase n=1 Tax=Cereibacter azotoformans TaxID=43057 RepID=A0A2T5JU30_9RHOB|nr:histidine kinase dimerization/phosphoacceptor domain -containing protein [Cereibacter azotoformans]AXQ93426.1 response regulator [Cereibacter sphaeroides]MBO4168817.1 response regulator [Cereibacter azotoformans]PTR13538.1 signal transduction histidine kinase [Cereibacter azotoformans]UIJ31758.1 response regulator [Cereibacter azotoformans]